MAGKSKYNTVLTKEFFEKEYFTNKLALYKIASKYKIDPQTVTRYFRLYGFEVPRMDDITGKKYGTWTVVKFNSKKASGSYWLCKCKCGTERVVSRCKLISGQGNRCIKCFNKQRTIKTKFRPNVVLAKIKANLKHRPLEFNIDEKYITNLFYRQRRKCAISGVLLTCGKTWKDFINNTMSLDRIDSNLGYIKGNVQWVHKDINNMKCDYDDEYFINFCKLVAEHNKEKK